MTLNIPTIGRPLIVGLAWVTLCFSMAGCGGTSENVVTDVDAEQIVAPDVYGELIAQMEADRERARSQKNGR